MAIFSILSSSLSPPRGATPLSLSLSLSYFSYNRTWLITHVPLPSYYLCSSNPLHLDQISLRVINVWSRIERGVGKRETNIDRTILNSCPGRVSPAEEIQRILSTSFQGSARASTKSNRRNYREVRKRAKFTIATFSSTLWHGIRVSVSGLEPSHHPREGSLSKENEKILSSPISISDAREEEGSYKNISFFPLRRPSLDLTRMMDRQYHAALKWCNRDARMHVICRNDIFNHELLSTIVKRKSTFITGTRRALCELSTLIIARTGCYRIVIGKKRVVVGSEMIQLLIFFSFFLFWIRY